MEKEKTKAKKITFSFLIVLDFSITIFLFVISLIMLIKTSQMKQSEIMADTNVGFIAYLQKHPTFYLWVFVVPLFILLATNIVALVLFTKKTVKSEPVHVDSLTEDQKKALLDEMIKEQKKKEKSEETSDETK